MNPHDLKPVERCCVADGVTSQRDVLSYKPVYLRHCAFHLDLWKRADAAALIREMRSAQRGA